MKQFFKMFFASLLAMVVAGFILVGIFIGMIVSVTKSFSEKNKAMNTSDVLVIDLSKRIHEQGRSNSLAGLSNSSAFESGMYDISKALATAKNDNDIKGIVIKLSSSPNGWATLQQLRMSLINFKSSGKFIYAYGENITQGAYFVATAADSIYLNPAGNIDLKGLATVMTFFKGTLDKLEVNPKIFYAGKFKSATEPFRADKISDPNRLQISAMQKGLWDQFLLACADYTHADVATINGWAQTAAIQFPADAAKNKMVAGLLYWDQVEQRIKAKTGQGPSTPVKMTPIEEYASNNNTSEKYTGDKIAILMAEGQISDGEQNGEYEIASETFCQDIRKLAKDDNVKAVVLRVNSPGGSALASEVILRELTLLKQKKPLVVSMGDYTASGGYYICMSADSIFALPNTITGSIGVFGMMFNVDKLMKNKLGITFDEVKNAPYADLPTVSRPLTAVEAQRMQAGVDTIYELFKGHVVKGRKLNQAEVDSIAQGRVYTGTDALALHLVDAYGGLNRAINAAASLAKVKEYRVATYPAPEDKLKSLLRKFKNNTDASSAIKTAVKDELGPGFEWVGDLQSLRKMNGRAMMTMPFVPVFE